ncbi:CDGSH iron-sulfur domain-containing protein [Fontimonas thermophila]|uniref:CDGSH iron-sulfur domain-containing protein n=1 Tax=Fontimonas thermophila TaxID=1076937 RepID=UPI00345084F2
MPRCQSTSGSLVRFADGPESPCCRTDPVDQHRDHRRCRQTGPWVIDLPAGAYRWCGCGRSRTAPFCEARPAAECHTARDFTITGRVRTVWLCRCGLSAKAPYCDGRHHRLRT